MLLVTFSGLDGCGKSTHVDETVERLRGRGLVVRRLVSHQLSMSRLATDLTRAIRQGLMRQAVPTETSATGHRIRRLPDNRSFSSDRERGSSRARRALAYPVDALLLNAWFLAQRISGVDAVVCDRYMHDKLVNLPVPDGVLGRLLLSLVPRPDLAVFLSVPPSVCRQRREEHPEDYYVTKGESYRRISERFGMTTIENVDLLRARARLDQALAAVGA